MSRYSSKSSNPFEGNEDDFVFVPDERKNRSPFVDNRRQQLMIHESEDRQLESTQRALASLYESEAMGNATAEELLRQREVIQNIEKKTDDISTTLTSSQRHLNNIKSVFGGIKNWWGGKKEPTPADNEQKKGSSLDSMVKKQQEASSSLQASSSWEQGSYQQQGDADLDRQFLAQSSATSVAGRSSYQYVQPITRSAREEELDKNLGMMSDGLGRLKHLAQGLGEEIDDQNETLERVKLKVDRASGQVENQNKQMNKILK